MGIWRLLLFLSPRETGWKGSSGQMSLLWMDGWESHNVGGYFEFKSPEDKATIHSIRKMPVVQGTE